MAQKAITSAKALLKKRPKLPIKGKVVRKVGARIPIPGFLKAIGGYFAGSWRELREVRWPNRKTTWQLTVAVMLFTAFFSVVILALDRLFEAIFKRILL